MANITANSTALSFDPNIAMSALSGFDYMSLAPFVLVVVASFIVAKIVYFILQKFAKQLVGKTETILDDLLLAAVEGPITYGIVIAGLYVGALMSSLAHIPLVVGLFQILLIIWGGVTANRIAGAFIHWYVVEVAPKQKISLHDLEPLARRLVAVLSFVFCTILILSTVGVEVGPFIASLGIAGLAVALALQDTLGNFFGGVSISVDRPLRHGDYIEVSDIKLAGWVDKIGWRSTRIKTSQNNVIIIPNSKLAQAVIVNYHMPDKEMAVVVPVSVSYDSDLAKVERVTLEVADHVQKMHEGAVKGFKPVVRYASFGDSGINFNVVMRASEFVESGPMTHIFIAQLHSRYAKEGIEIPFPTRTIHFENGDSAKLLKKKK